MTNAVADTPAAAPTTLAHHAALHAVAAEIPCAARFPAWLRRRVPQPGKHAAVEESLRSNRIHTVCREARCPNRTECYARGTATFLILGNSCTRACAFCAIAHDDVFPPDPLEPGRIARAAAEMKLSHVVITSVTRDDLADGGAEHFAHTVEAVRGACSHATIEVLTPDFLGSLEALRTVLESGPDVFNHNVETVSRLYPRVRPQASYRRSLNILSAAAQRSGKLAVKSGLMVGLGETVDEVEGAMSDIRETGCSVLTIGQYLRPSPAQVAVTEFIPPEQFGRYTEMGLSMGFSSVVAGPFVRSSYKADEIVSGLRQKTIQ